jgi:hypothetical protein
MVGLISGCKKSSTTKGAPASDSFLNASCASLIVDTVVRPILMSHGPLILVRQCAIFGTRGAWRDATKEELTVNLGKAEACCTMVVEIKFTEVDDFLQSVKIWAW